MVVLVRPDCGYIVLDAASLYRDPRTRQEWYCCG